MNYKEPDETITLKIKSSGKTIKAEANQIELKHIITEKLKKSPGNYFWLIMYNIVNRLGFLFDIIYGVSAGLIAVIVCIICVSCPQESISSWSKMVGNIYLFCLVVCLFLDHALSYRSGDKITPGRLVILAIVLLLSTCFFTHVIIIMRDEYPQSFLTFFVTIKAAFDSAFSEYRKSDFNKFVEKIANQTQSS